MRMGFSFNMLNWIINPRRFKNGVYLGLYEMDIISCFFEIYCGGLPCRIDLMNTQANALSHWGRDKMTIYNNTAFV